MSKKPDPPESSQDGALSKNTRRLFTALMLLIPVLFFVLLEGGLRLGGYGADYPLFEPVDGYPDVLVQNTQVARRYFVHEREVPNANADYFDRVKAQGTVRIITQGGSSAAGFPYYWGAAFPRVVGTRLRDAYPDRSFEVINTSMAAVNSYTLLDLAEEIIEQQPDAVFVYAGHNEYYGALGAASSESLGRNPALIRTLIRLRRFRTVQGLSRLIARIRSGAAGQSSGTRPDNTLMARMVGEQQVPLDSDLFEAGLNQFTSNLEALLATYQEAGIPVYIGTLASNERDQRPFISVPSRLEKQTAWEAALSSGREALAASDTLDALDAFERAVSIDSLAADGYFYLGETLAILGRVENARSAFTRAKDLDALRFRAPEVFNTVIRQLATAYGATIVESQDALRDASPDGLIGSAMMLEHLHPTLDGYSVIADAFYDRYVETAGLGQPRPTPPGHLARLVTPVDSVLGLIRMDKLTREWPFRPDEVRPLQRDTSRTPAYVYELADALFEGGAAWNQTTGELATWYEGRGDLQDARRARRALTQAYPFLSSYWEQLANLELRMGQTYNNSLYIEQAAENFSRALARDPRNATATSMLGALYLNQQRTEEAITLLERGVALQPENQQALYNLSGAYALSGRMNDARATVQRLLRINPQHPGGQALLASLPS